MNPLLHDLLIDIVKLTNGFSIRGSNGEVSGNIRDGFTFEAPDEANVDTSGETGTGAGT